MFSKRERPNATDALPIFALVNGVYAICSRNLLMVVRAGAFPFVLCVIISLWETPSQWGEVGFHVMRAIEWVLLLGIWTIYACQLQRFVLKGPMEGRTSYLPKLDGVEKKFAIASAFIILPFTLFAIAFQQHLFFHQPDLIVMLAELSFRQVPELVYGALIAGIVVQIFAFVLPMISNGDDRPFKAIVMEAFDGMRLHFLRLFGASIVVVVPVWVFVAFLRIILHTPFFTQFALGDAASALFWNFMFDVIETFKVIVSGGLLAMIWALAYARHRNKAALDFINEN